MSELKGELQSGKNTPAGVQAFVDKIDSAEGLHIVVPEYNGSFPGVLKHFIDFWTYPKSFEYRPVCFVGLGGMFGGLRPVEQLQQVFGYRNAFMYPDRIFMANVWGILKDDVIADDTVNQLLEKQITGFQKFVTALKSEKLDSKKFGKKNNFKTANITNSFIRMIFHSVLPTVIRLKPSRQNLNTLKGQSATIKFVLLLMVYYPHEAPTIYTEP